MIRTVAAMDKTVISYTPDISQSLAGFIGVKKNDSETFTNLAELLSSLANH